MLMKGTGTNQLVYTPNKEANTLYIEIGVLNSSFISRNLNLHTVDFLLDRQKVQFIFSIKPR